MSRKNCALFLKIIRATLISITLLLLGIMIYFRIAHIQLDTNDVRMIAVGAILIIVFLLEANRSLSEQEEIFKLKEED